MKTLPANFTVPAERLYTREQVAAMTHEEFLQAVLALCPIMEPAMLNWSSKVFHDRRDRTGAVGAFRLFDVVSNYIDGALRDLMFDRPGCETFGPFDGMKEFTCSPTDAWRLFHRRRDSLALGIARDAVRAADRKQWRREIRRELSKPRATA